ncbi:hypothetical protein [Erwinia psidii]|nr:hypothetical protein [Erwinia psidii]
MVFNMVTMSTVRKELDSQLQISQSNFYQSAAHIKNPTLGDWHKFNHYMRQYSSSTWAANQEVTLNHNLARSIINDIR